MIRVDEVGVLPVTREQGFAYITDPHNWPEFVTGFSDLREGPDARFSEPGDIVHVKVTSILGRREIELRLLERVPGRVVRYVTSESPFLPGARHERQFHDDPGGLLFQVLTEFEVRPGPAGILDRLVGSQVRRLARRSITNLQNHFTAERAQAGRAAAGAGSGRVKEPV